MRDRTSPAWTAPHEGALSSAPPHVGGKLSYLNDMLDRASGMADEIEERIVGRSTAVPAPADPRVPQTPAGSDGMIFKLDLAITRLTGLVGQLESIRRPFADPEEEAKRGQTSRNDPAAYGSPRAG